MVTVKGEDTKIIDIKVALDLTEINPELIDTLAKAKELLKEKLKEHTDQGHEHLIEIMKKIAERRKELLKEKLHQGKISEILSELLSSENQKSLSQLLGKDKIETDTTLEGDLEVTIYDDFKNGTSNTEHTLVTSDNHRIHLHSVRPILSRLISGTKVKVKGLHLDDEFILDAQITDDEQSNFQLNIKKDPITNIQNLNTHVVEGLEVTNTPPTTVKGNQKIIVILAKYQNDNNEIAFTPEEIHNRIFTDSNSLNAYYKEVSYNKVSFSGNVIRKWYTLPMDAPTCGGRCEIDKLKSEIIKISDPDVDFTMYNRILVIMNSWTYAMGGFSNTGMIDVDTQDGTIRASVSFVVTNAIKGSDRTTATAHEIGHALGLNHANGIKCTGDILYSIDLLGDNCISEQYKHPFTVMGSGYFHMGAFEKEYLGWFEPKNVVEVTNSGKFTLTPIETPSLTDKKVLKIKLGLKYLYVESREEIGFDETINNGSPGISGQFNATNGILLSVIYDIAIVDKIKNSWNVSSVLSPFWSLVDTTPDSITNYFLADFYDAALKPNIIFKDPDTGTIIRVVSKTKEHVEVEVLMENTFTENKAILIEPAPETTLSSSTVTFEWNPDSTGGPYGFHVGSEYFWRRDIYSNSNLMDTSVTITNDAFISGKPIYVRIFSKVDGVDVFEDYTYKTSGSRNEIPAKLLEPAPGTTLTLGEPVFVKFQWSPATTGGTYGFHVGTTPGGTEIFSNPTSSSTNVNINIKSWLDGNPIYVRLYSKANGKIVFEDYTYQTLAPVKTPVPIANFTATPTSGTAPLTVQFTDSSTNNPTSWWWDFGDERVTILQNPSHTYQKPGTYTVSLWAKNDAGNDQIIESNLITVSGSSSSVPVANFSATPTSGTAPLTVQFTDSSTNNPTSWWWEFGNGWKSTQQNPSFTYQKPGTYTVNMWARNASGNHKIIKSNFITVTSSSGGVPVANFSATPTSGTAPLTVQFTDTSTNNPTSWWWDFGDERVTILQNPSHTYQKPGTYTVSLWAKNAAGNNQIIKSNFITVTGSSSSVPVANFSATPTSGTAPLTVQFTDTSTNNPTSWFWEFGDGWKSTRQNTSHTYQKPGTYTINMWARNASGNDQIIKSDFITVRTSSGGGDGGKSIPKNPNPTPYTYKSFSSGLLTLYPYKGKNIALLVPSKDYDPSVLDKIITSIDTAYDFYKNATGQDPKLFINYEGLTSIAVVPKTCGAGCGYLGFTGIELTETTFSKMYHGVKNENKYQHAVFYELGRNFWFYSNKIGYKKPDENPVTTGFAILMRFASMEFAKVDGTKFRDVSFTVFKNEIENLVDLYLKDTTLRWENTLKIGKTPKNLLNLGASDLFASFVLRLKKMYGNDFLLKLWKEVANRPDAKTTQEAVDNFMLAASAASGNNLAWLFKNKWRWPISDAASQEALQKFGLPRIFR